MTTEKAAPTPISDAAAFRASGHSGKGALVVIDDARKLERESIRLAERLKEAREALQRIEQWNSFPPTGKVWPESRVPMSYGAAFGSNGERDFMRDVAHAALLRSGEGE